MPSMALKVQYRLELDAVELRLIMRALSGKLTEEDIANADQLGADLARIRSSGAKSLIESNEKLLANMSASGH